MKHIEELNKLPQNTDLTAGVVFSKRAKHQLISTSFFSGYIFLLCFHGTCLIKVNLNQYTMKKGSLLILLPDVYLQILEESDDCLFIFVGFNSEIVNSSSLFIRTMEYIPFILDNPIIYLDTKVYKLVYNYIRTLINVGGVSNNMITQELAALTFAQFILGLGELIKDGKTVKNQCNRNQEIVKELFSIVLMNYKTERSVAFYADKMRLSPKYLSTIIKKVTGKTVTHVISSFIINDAKAKLKSTSLTVQEIAYSLNFPDISFFGKYFKRYTGMSPKQYRYTDKSLQISPI